MSAPLGIMVAPDRVVAIRVRSTPRGPRIATRVEHPLAAGPADGAWPELLDALRRIIEEVGGASEVGVALHRSFGLAKTIAVPRLPRHELRGLVTRHAGRYFLTAVEPSLVDVVPVRGGRAGTPVRALAAQASAAVVEAVLGALQAAGLRCHTVTPASCAITDAAWLLVPASRRGAAIIAVCEGGWSEGIVARDGKVLAVEARAGIAAAELGVRAARLAESVLGSPPNASPQKILLVADADRESAAAAVAGAGFSLLSLPADLVAVDPAALAAFGATQATVRTPQTVPERVWERAAAVERIRVACLTAVAVILVMAAGAAHLWGLRRELATIAAERQSHARAVGTALAIEREIEGVRARLEAVRQAEAEGTHWSRVLASVAQTLPDSAFLVAFAADSARVRLDGIAPGAAHVASALSASRLLHDVTLVSAFRSQGSEEVERFAMTLAVQRASAPVSTASRGAGQ